MAHLARYCSEAAFPDRDLERIRIAALRDRAMLALDFASDGCRRPEISRLSAGNLVAQPDIIEETTGAAMPSLAISLGRRKAADTGAIANVSGAPVGFLAAWVRPPTHHGLYFGFRYRGAEL